MRRSSHWRNCVPLWAAIKSWSACPRGEQTQAMNMSICRTVPVPDHSQGLLVLLADTTPMTCFPPGCHYLACAISPPKRPITCPAGVLSQPMCFTGRSSFAHKNMINEQLLSSSTATMYLLCMRCYSAQLRVYLTAVCCVAHLAAA